MDFTRRGSGPCLVLLPGLGCDHRMWEPVATLLQERFSTILPNIWPVATLDGTAARVVDLLDRLGLSGVGLAGLSMGGYVAFEILRQAPERVRGVAFADTTAFPDPPDRVAKRHQVLRLLGEGRFEQVLEAFVGSVLAPATPPDSKVRDLLYAMARELGPETFACATRAILHRGRYEEVLEHLRVPALFVCGEHDTLTPPEVAVRMSERVPGSRRFIVPRAGHMAVLENPESVAGALATFFGTSLSPSG